MNNLMRLLLAVILLWASAPTLADAANLKAIVADKFSAWKEGTGSPFELLADNVQWRVEGEGPLAGTYSKDRFVQELVLPFNRKLASPLVPSEPELFQDGNTVIARFSAQATLHSAKRYTNSYIWVMYFEGREISKVNAFLNLPAFERVMSLPD